ncbi:MAG: heparan-alpha-glucosaminide N-acetyltransferase domain-containing protein [Acidobacteriaceae bacterium]|jgi:predicted acyltransferase
MATSVTKRTVTTTTAPQTTPMRRLVSLDVVRGITIAFMILVNNGGSGKYSYSQLEHSAWNGWTLTDLVFPSFLFIAGISIVFSNESRMARGESKAALRLHVIKRSLILFLLGLVVNGFPLFNLGTLRIYGVLQRIAICFLFASLLYLWNSRAWIAATTAVVALLGYWILMRWVPIPGIGVPTHGVPLLDPNNNWVAYVDRKIFPGRLYEGTRDPEGLISNIPAMGTILFGVLTGIWLRRPKSLSSKAAGLLAASVSGLLLGSLWNVWFPINKRLWTSSYVLFAAGCTLLLLAICFYAVEIREWTRGWTFPWLVFGSNAITAYVFSELLAAALSTIGVRDGARTIVLQQYIYQHWFFPVVNPSFGSLLYAIAFVLVCFLPVVWLYRKKIFIKI